MKAREGEEIVCKCPQPVGNFLRDVDDHAAISSEDFAISLPPPNGFGRHVCPTCYTTVAQHFGDHWRVWTKRGWLA
jgi:hypothetical protein